MDVNVRGNQGNVFPIISTGHYLENGGVQQIPWQHSQSLFGTKAVDGLTETELTILRAHAASSGMMGYRTCELIRYY